MLDSLENSLKKIKILVVEDDLVSVIYFKIILKEIASEILICDNGENAVEICRNNPDIDLVLMDLKLKAMSGNEATKQIRLFNKEIIIIAQTACIISGTIEKAIIDGCNDYISKPINKKNLFLILQMYFSKD